MPTALADPRLHLRWLALAAVVALAFAGFALHGPIVQPAAYHGFADTRSLWGVPNVADVASSLVFALVGGWGLIALSRPDPGLRSRPAWLLLCAALVAIAAGSAFYHWVPGNGRLVFDRIPIACACTALLAAFAADRGLPWAARPAVLAAAAGVAASTVLWWWWTGREGSGDLRPYVVVQALPMLIVPLVLLLRLPRIHLGTAPDSAWWGVFCAYAVAKLTEHADHAVFVLSGGALGGHTLKHLLAAAGAAWLLRGMVAARRQNPASGATVPR